MAFIPRKTGILCIKGAKTHIESRGHRVIKASVHRKRYTCKYFKSRDKFGEFGFSTLYRRRETYQTIQDGSHKGRQCADFKERTASSKWKKFQKKASRRLVF